MCALCLSRRSKLKKYETHFGGEVLGEKVKNELKMSNIERKNSKNNIKSVRFARFARESARIFLILVVFLVILLVFLFFFNENEMFFCAHGARRPK